MILHLRDGFKEDLPQPFMPPDRPVVTLDIGVLLRLAGLDVLEADAVHLGPFHQRAADIFGAVIDPNSPRLAAPFDDLVPIPPGPKESLLTAIREGGSDTFIQDECVTTLSSQPDATPINRKITALFDFIEKYGLPTAALHAP
ncbi:hypothetical protein PHAMO_340144 [Magnetospirillum molischianum DSM 120]|uniref:Uncharacterized protein n=1 Tax=Magnetospirillum molischianum DSM 120 TaxID=1150626 RepID=H8FV83_MAGML|nr:hypothetical protein PHAMO_340144 [Magnetospirillum molischianum DSM 120]